MSKYKTIKNTGIKFKTHQVHKPSIEYMENKLSKNVLTREASLSKKDKEDLKQRQDEENLRTTFLAYVNRHKKTEFGNYMKCFFKFQGVFVTQTFHSKGAYLKHIGSIQNLI